MHYDSDNLSFIFSFHDYRLQGVLDSFVCPDKIKMTKSIFYALKFRLQTSWILSTVYQAFFLDILKKLKAKKTQGSRKTQGIFPKTQGFFPKTQVFANS